MDVIAGRKTQGKITGDILVNGYPKDQKTWSRVVGYVEQMDIHSPQVAPVKLCKGEHHLQLLKHVTHLLLSYALFGLLTELACSHEPLCMSISMCVCLFVYLSVCAMCVSPCR